MGSLQRSEMTSCFVLHARSYSPTGRLAQNQDIAILIDSLLKYLLSMYCASPLLFPSPAECELQLRVLVPVLWKV
jgi:hypothetical protein